MSDAPHEQNRPQEAPQAPRFAAADQWQNISTLDIPNAGQQAAQSTVDHYFGIPMITGTDGLLYQQGHISNVPEISPAVQNFDDLKTLATGIGSGLQDFGKQALNYLQTRDSVRDSILQLGPVLDTAVNYYANTHVDQVGKDTQSALTAGGEAVEQNLSHALKPEQRGQQAGSLMPMFVLDGMKEPLRPETIEQMGLGSMSQQELGNLGINKLMPEGTELHMPEVPEHLRHLPLQPASEELLTAISGKGAPIRFANNAEDLGHLQSVKATAVYRMFSDGTNEIILPLNPTKIQALEEFLHSAQHRIGILDTLGEHALMPEHHVKDFMVRHAKMLGLSENDTIIMRAFRQEVEEELKTAGYRVRD